MTFASPLNLLWLLPAWGAITALYFLRRPRRNVDVPSTLLWRIAPQESVKRAKVQRFTPHILYFIQMLAALLLVLAIMQPEVRGGLGNGAPVAIVIDNGITSSANSSSTDRLRAEQTVAVKLLQDSALRMSKVVLVTTAPATVVGTLDSDSNQAAKMVSDIRSTDAASDIPSSVSIAASALRSLSKSHQSPEIVLISDMAWPTAQDTAVTAASKGIQIASYSIGSDSGSTQQNAAITRLSVERSSVDPDSRLQIFTQVSANSQVNGCTLELDENGNKIVSKQIDISPDSPATLVTDIDAPSKSQELTAQITPPSGFHDSVADDNTAYAVVPAAGGLHVLLVSGGNTALENALSILPGVHVTEISPVDYAQKGVLGQFDVSIFDGVTPDPKRPVSGGELIWGGADRSFTNSTGTPVWQNIVDWSRSDPTLRFIDLGNTSIKTTSWDRVGAWTPLIESQEGIDAASTDQDGTRRVWTSFDPQESGFSTNPAFPIFVSNCVTWLSGSNLSSSDTVGAPITLSRVPRGWTVGAPGPGGEFDEHYGLCDTNGSPCSFAGTNYAGFYSVGNSNSAQVLQVPRNTSQSSLELSSQPHNIGVEASATSNSSAYSIVKSWQAVTGFEVALCLALLFAEWILFHKPVRSKPSVAVKVR